MFCPKCGKQLKPNSKFCSYCGMTLQNEEELQNEKKTKARTGKEQQKFLIILFSAIILVVIVGVVAFNIHMKNKKEMQQLKEDLNQLSQTTEATQEGNTTVDEAKEKTTTEESIEIVKDMYVDHVSQSVIFRTEPVEEKANENGTITLGTKVGFIKKANDTFSQISYNGEIGYVKTEYLSEEKPDLTVKYSMYIAGVNESVTLRKSPSTDSEEVCKIYLGEEVGFIEDTNSLFAKVKYGDRIGYVMSQYLSSSMPNTTISEWMYVDNVSKAIKLRKNATEDSDSYCDIPLGTEVGVIESVNSIYVRINYNGQLGYTKWEYLSYDRPNTTVSDYVYITNVKNSAYFRVRPTEDESNSNIICEIPLGEKVGYIENYDYTFAKVKYNGRVGYVKWDYLSFY